MNSTAAFEPAPFGNSHQGELGEIRTRGRSGGYLHYAGVSHRGAAGYQRRGGYQRQVHPHAYGAMHQLQSAGRGLYAHRLRRDFRHRLGIYPQPFGSPPPSAGTGFDGGAPDAPPPPDTGAPPPSFSGGGPGAEEQIRWIQSVLNTVQGANLPTDGMPSPDLRAALQTFQGQHGLPVSGFAGPDTIASLQAAAAGGASGGAPPPPGGEFEILPLSAGFPGSR